VLLVIAIADGEVGTAESAVLVLAYFGYVYYMWYGENARTHEERISGLENR
jgi:hypothetical protein